MDAVQFVGAERADDQYPRQRPLIADQKRQQIAGRPVGPVQVLDNQYHRAPLAELLKQGQHLLEQPSAPLTRVDIRSIAWRLTGLWFRCAKVGQQPGRLARPAAEQLDDARRAGFPHQFPQHGGERGERQAFSAKLNTATSQYPPALGASVPGELGGEPGLPDAGLAAEQHRGRFTSPDGRERRLKICKLSTPADEGRADKAAGHILQHAIGAEHRGRPVRRPDARRVPAGRPA